MHVLKQQHYIYSNSATTAAEHQLHHQYHRHFCSSFNNAQPHAIDNRAQRCSIRCGTCTPSSSQLGTLASATS
jgi:hypothetical protein